MRSLFLRIFVSFWVAQALFVVLAFVVAFALRPQRETAGWEALQTRILNQSVEAYKTGGPDAVGRYLSSLQTSEHIRAFLFDDEGREITGARPPDFIQHFQKGQPQTRSGFLRSAPARFLRQSSVNVNGQRFTLVMELPPRPQGLVGPSSVPLLWIMVAVVSSGLVCFPLARYMTRPVVLLRTATQKLAAGDLSARAGAAGAKRKDEIGELLHDFDSMADRLETMAKAQSRLWGDISHELRSPLARLSVALELARQRSGPEAKGVLDRIELESGRLNELIGRLLTIARLESGEDGIEKTRVHLEELVGEIARDAEFEAQSRRCRVKFEYSDGVEVSGNASLLRSAIENVVRNAIRYTREGSDVEVTLSQDPVSGDAVLLIDDSGPGVPSDQLDKLFRPFYRLDDARGRQTGGVGLGLAIVERSMRLHGGTAKASNRREGGLRVELRLPALPSSVDSVPQLTAQPS
jgi:two-component system sensor histidine kinase CpxA